MAVDHCSAPAPVKAELDQPNTSSAAAKATALKCRGVVGRARGPRQFPEALLIRFVFIF